MEGTKMGTKFKAAEIAGKIVEAIADRSLTYSDTAEKSFDMPGQLFEKIYDSVHKKLSE